MKRSEFIKDLTDIIYNSDIPGEWDKCFAITLAERIADYTAEIGMPPPAIKNPEIPKDWDKMTYYTNRAIATYHDEFMDYPEFSVNQWETEHEKEQ
jgi:hypothetical protein